MSKVFGERLAILRKSAGLTQKELAEKSGLSQNGISHWEAGDRDPSWENVLALAGALGIDCSVFQQEPAVEEKTERGRPVKESEAAIGKKPAKKKKK